MRRAKLEMAARLADSLQPRQRVRHAAAGGNSTNQFPLFFEVGRRNSHQSPLKPSTKLSGAASLWCRRVREVASPFTAFTPMQLLEPTALAPDSPVEAVPAKPFGYLAFTFLE
jgi:hypothetical protein